MLLRCTGRCDENSEDGSDRSPQLHDPGNQTVAGRFGIDTFGVGEDSGQPVTFDFKPPFAFNGEIKERSTSFAAHREL
jgi:hypothetical protein